MTAQWSVSLMKMKKILSETFVRFIADKSKSLWKRVTSKAKQSDEDETTGIASEAAVVEEEREAIQSRPPKQRRGAINVGGPS